MQQSAGKSPFIWCVLFSKAAGSNVTIILKLCGAKVGKLSGGWSRALTQGLNPQKDSALESHFLPGTGRPNNTTFRQHVQRSIQGLLKDS